MLARNETIFKWTLYAMATALCFLAQLFVLQRMTILGVIPFIYPVIPAVLATYEKAVSGTVFALAVGVVCDLILPGPIPCFYTLVFPVAGLCAALLSKGLLTAGFVCSLAATATAFTLTGVFHCVLLWIQGKAAWSAGASVCAREFLVSAVLILPVMLLFSAVYRRTHLDD